MVKGTWQQNAPLKIMADNNSYENKKDELIFHFNEIYRICENKFTKGWGSYLFNGHNYEYDERMFEKQKLVSPRRNQYRRFVTQHTPVGSVITVCNNVFTTLYFFYYYINFCFRL